ncbi:hypothetical protein KFU94_62500 [Chloroflexi bacterium TSY]|nr:hypothetical protein [Chloroflexi bacterium TSY]
MNHPSYDGRKDSKTYGESLPEGLNLVHIELEAGRSTQSTLLGQQDLTYESLYLSSALIERLDLTSSQLEKLAGWKSSHTQLKLAFA